MCILLFVYECISIINVNFRKYARNFDEILLINVESDQLLYIAKPGTIQKSKKNHFSMQCLPYNIVHYTFLVHSMGQKVKKSPGQKNS